MGVWRRAFGPPPGPMVEYDPAKDEIDARLAQAAARLAEVRRRELDWRRFQAEKEARGMIGDEAGGRDAP